MSETVVAALARHARERPLSLALADDRVRLNWRETEEWVNAAAGWFVSHRIPRGAAVLGWLPNCIEWYLLRLACERSGLFWVPVPASLGMRELSSIAERVRPAVAVGVRRYRARALSQELKDILVARDVDSILVTIEVSSFLRLQGPTSSIPHALELRENAHALATTGSEGIPKLAVYSLAAACARGHAQATLLDLSASDLLLTLSPGVGPARAAWLAAPFAGAGVIAVPVFGAQAALEGIERERPTAVCGTPSQFSKLMAGLAKLDTSSVRLWYMAGSVLPVTLAEQLEAQTHGKVVSTYGGADFGGWAATDPRDAPSVRHRTVGRGRGGTEFRIIDSHGHEVPSGAAGELVGRGPCCVHDYLGEAGRDRWRNGWFYTGDLASLDSDGNIVILGRLKDVIIRGGDNVSPAEIEALLRRSPAVLDVAVIGVSDPVLGERVCACVIPAAEHAPQLESLRAHLSGLGVAHYKLPEQLVLLDTLPSVGDKIDRRTLAEVVAARDTAA